MEGNTHFYIFLQPPLERHISVKILSAGNECGNTLSGGVVVLPLTSHTEDWVFKPSLRQTVQAVNYNLSHLKATKPANKMNANKAPQQDI